MLQIGYIICPSDITLTKYINTCYKTETVSIVTEGGQIRHNCKITISVLQEIHFPNQKKEEITGSAVVWDFQATNVPIIIGTFSRNDEASFLLPHQYKFYKHDGDNYASIVVDGKEGSITNTVSGQNIASLIFRAIGKTLGRIVFEVSHKFNVKAIDQFQVQSNKITLGRKELEPAVLGQTLKDEILDPLFEEIAKLTVPTAFGPSGTPINTPQFKEIQNKLDNILSIINELE